MKQKGNLSIREESALDASARSVARYLEGQDYPAGREDLLATARANNAPKQVIDTLEDLPEQVFDGPGQVMNAVT